MQYAVFVQIDDWEALYIDGQRVNEGTSIDLADSLDGRSMEFSARRWWASDESYAEEFGNFPETLQELDEYCGS